MPRNGSGNYTLPAGNPVITNTVVSSVWANSTLADLAAEITNSVAADGQTSPIADLPMGAHKHVNVSLATLRNQYATVAQTQDNAYTLLTGVGGTANAITASVFGDFNTYKQGQIFYLVPTVVNGPGGVTLNINNVGVRDVYRQSEIPLNGGDLLVGHVYPLTYNGTRFNILTQYPDEAAGITQAQADIRYLSKIADDVTVGNLSVTKSNAQMRVVATSGESTLVLSGLAGADRCIRFYTGAPTAANSRWVQRCNSVGESGAAAGSNMEFVSYNDSGTGALVRVGINRATGLLSAFYGLSSTTGAFSGLLSANGGLSGTTGTFSGAVSGSAGTFSGAVSGTTGTFSGLLSANGGLSGTTGTFSGLLSAPGGVTGTTGTFSALLKADGGLTGTTGTFSGAVTGTTFTASSGNFVSPGAVALCTTGANTVFLRPNGAGATTGQIQLTSAGNVIFNGALSGISTIAATGTITTNGVVTGSQCTSSAGTFATGVAWAILAPGSAGTVYLRPNGNAVTTGEMTVATSGAVSIANTLSVGLSASIASTVTCNSIYGNATSFVVSTSGPGTLLFRPRGPFDGTGQATINSSGVFLAAGDCGYSSDERLKKNFREIALSGAQIAGLWFGEFERTDLEITQVGIKAQQLQKIIPQTIHTDARGFLTVDYGRAALLAVIQLAREVEELRKLKVA